MYSYLLATPPNPALIDFEHTPHNILASYGPVHMYAVFITLGIILSVLASYIRLKIKNVPTEPLIWSVFIIIPASLFGASFFGKFNNDPSHPWTSTSDGTAFWSLFAFWEAGLSIHGGVLFGIIAGIIVFGFAAKKSKVSRWVYTDCIIPNILLGQILGRWGNFFNHELLGEPTTYEAISWLPAFIRDNLWQWSGSAPEMSGGEIVYRQPIFLYESFFNFIAWVIIIFVIPYVGQLFGKKPWKKDPKSYPFDVKYTFKNFFNRKYIVKDKMTWKEVWDKAYFNYSPKQSDLDHLKSDLKTESEKQSKFQKWWNTESNTLTKINNPGKYCIVRSGVQTGLYFFFWNLIRFILELQREDERDLFIQNNRPLDYTVLILITIFGLLLAAFTQWFAPKKWRKNGYTYEKEYVDYHSLQNWKLEKFLTNNIVIGEDNYGDKLPTVIKNKTMDFLGYDKNDFAKYFVLENFKTNNSDNKGEVTNFSFKIKSIGQKENIFESEIFINHAIKIDLSKILNKQVLHLQTAVVLLTRDEFSLMLNDIVNLPVNQARIKSFWEQKYRNINYDKTTMFTVDFNKLVNVEQIKFPIGVKKIEITKFKFKEDEFHYFTKKIKFNLERDIK